MIVKFKTREKREPLATRFPTIKEIESELLDEVGEEKTH
jgi:hypothetical protein